MLAAVALTSCEFHPATFTWYDQLETGGPCYAVDLTDGLSEESTQELHDTFTCLNDSGNLDPLLELEAVMDTRTRTSTFAGIELAVVINDLPAAGIDPFAIAGDIVDWMEDPDGRDAVDAFWEAVVELMYGVPHATLSTDGYPLNTGAALDQGLIRPLLPAMRAGAAAVLDDDLRALELTSAMLDSELTLSLLHTTAAWAEEPSLESLVADVPRKLGAAIDASRSPANDRWSQASGDSLRDLVQALLIDVEDDGRIVFAHLEDPLRELVDDDRLRDDLEQTLGDLHAGGALQAYPVELMHLIGVGAGGGALGAGDDSAFAALIRLLHSGDRPVRCSLNVLGWDIGLLELDNLSADMLKVFAELDPDQAVDTVDLLGGALNLEILGFELTDYVLDQVASGGLCTDRDTGDVVIDSQYVSDLDALDRLNDPAAGQALRTSVHLLAAVHDAQQTRIPALTTLLSGLWVHDLAPPLEEVLRDLGDSALLTTALDFIPALRAPQDYADDHDYPDGVEPLTFEDEWAVLRAALAPQDSGKSAIEELARPFAAVAAEPETWDALGNLAIMLQDPAQHLNSPGSILLPLLDLDPDLALTRALGGVILAPPAGGPLLRIAEHQEFVDALGRADADQEGPLPFVARLVTGGTLETLLRMIDRALIAL